MQVQAQPQIPAPHCRYHPAVAMKPISVAPKARGIGNAEDLINRQCKRGQRFRCGVKGCPWCDVVYAEQP